jgi:HEAT repeat protein
MMPPRLEIRSPVAGGHDARRFTSRSFLDPCVGRGLTAMADSTPATRVGLRAAAAVAILAFANSPGCTTPYLGTTAASYLGKVRESRDPNVRYLAYSRLASPRCYDDDKQKDVAVKVLVENLQSEREPLATRAVICRTLGDLHRPEARDALIKATGDPDAVVRAEACRAIGKVGRSEDASLLARIMKVDTDGDCRIAAMEGLGDLKSNDPRIAALLVEGMEHENPAIRLASLKALRKITGKDLGVDPKPWRDEVQKTARVDPVAPASKPETSAPR